MTTAQSRIKLIDTPVAAPGVCCLCGTAGGDGRAFIDFGKQLDWYGAVYFCSFCLAEVAEAIGYIPIVAYDELNKKSRELQIAFDQYQAKMMPVDDALREYFSNHYNKPASDIGSIGDVVPPVEESEPNERDNTISSEGESKTDESSNVEGSDDLFDDTDFD